MTDKPRIRDLYGAYEQGLVSFEDVVRAADRVLERFATEHGPHPHAGTPPRAATKPPRD